jgi:xylan 1,4-beta-xylosidase
MAVIHNPILPGFNPDPSVCRVGEDFYIATSTFEWFPGVQIHHSRDLVHWRLLTHALTRQSQLDMRGNPNSGGIWAPCLTYADGQFWLIYTDVKNLHGQWKDTPNFLVTAPSIEGPWSEPIYLNSSGFDPSLFHDSDGRKWLVNMLWDHRKGRHPFAGIVLQEYSTKERKLVGPIRNIFAGTSLRVTEGPHLYRRDGWYYLLTAEGGTGYAHAVTLARSKDIAGPYEVHPQNPVLTAQGRPEVLLQKAGHASIVDTPSGEWYMVHLASRPITQHRRCMLGRETSIQKVAWGDDGWLRLEGGGNSPQAEVPVPKLPAHPFPAEPARDDFDSPSLGVHYATLRVPADEEWLSLRQRPGFLRIRGRECPNSNHSQSVVARRVQAFECTFATCMEFAPEDFQQMAGLVAIYNTQMWYYLRVTHDEKLGRCLGVIACDKGEYSEPTAGAEVCVEGWNRVYLKAAINHEKLNFYFSQDGENWQPVGDTFDASKLSDDYIARWGFTGAFVGMACHDVSGRKIPADFDWFEYREK